MSALEREKIKVLELRLNKLTVNYAERIEALKDENKELKHYLMLIAGGLTEADPILTSVEMVKLAQYSLEGGNS